MSQRAACVRVALEAVLAAGSTIMDREADDCVTQDETVKKLIEALELQKTRTTARCGGSKDGTDHCGPIGSIFASVTGNSGADICVNPGDDATAPFAGKVIRLSDLDMP